MRYKAIKRYRDSDLERVVIVGEEIKIADKQRADQLLRAGYIEKKKGRPRK